MQYTIAEVAKTLEVSKNTIYNRLKGLEKDLKGLTKVSKGITYIEEEGLELIRKAIYVDNGETKENENIDNTVNPFQALQEDYINSLKSEIDYLKNQLSEQTEIVKRQQTLQLNEQQNTKQTILMLEEHNKEVDEKLSSWRSEQLEKQQEKKTGLFTKLFSK